MPRFRYCELWSDVKCNGGVREHLIPNRYLVKAGYRKALDVPEGGFLDIASAWFDPPSAILDNLLLRSEELDHAAWTNVGSPVVTADAAVAPDGTTTADQIADTSAAETRGRRQTLAIAADAASYCASIFVKKRTSPHSTGFVLLNLRFVTTGTTVDAYVVADIYTGAVAKNAAASACGIESRGDYWRVWITAANNGDTQLLFSAYPGGTDSFATVSTAVAGQGTEVFWGAQVNAGSVPRPYTRTTTAAATNPHTKRTGPTSTALRKGKVIRFCTTDATVFDEWRVMDVFDGNGPGPRITHVTLEPISADGNRAIFAGFDATGQPYHDYRNAEATAEQVIDDAILPALADAGVDYVAKGDVELAGVFDFAAEDGDTATTMLKRAVDADHANGEARWRRNGTTNYLIDIVEEIGSDADIVHVRTRRNLERWKRHQNGLLGFNRVRMVGQDDGTQRGLGRAYFKILSVNTADDWIGIGHPLFGAGSSLALLRADQLNGRYIQQLGPTLIEAQILDTDAVNNRIYVADASAFSAGAYVEFRMAAGVNAARLWYLDNPAQQAIDGGVYLRTLERQLGSGAVSYMPDPFTANLFVNPWEVTQAGTISTSTSSDDVLGTGTSFTDLEPGMRLIRDSDSELIGVILSITDDETLVLEANALIDLTDEAYATQQPLPQGWTIDAPGGVPILSGVDANTVPGATAFSAVLTAAGNQTVTFETAIPFINKDSSWRIWSWLDFISLAGTVVVTVSLRRVDTGAIIGSAITYTTAGHNATRQIAEFVGQNISAATTGVRIRMVIAGTGAHSWNIRFGPLGTMPSAWTRQDRYGPLANLGPSAVDLWYDAQVALEESGAPEGYELELRDLERNGGLAAEELVLGGTLNVYDTDLDRATLQRIEEIDVQDVWQPLLTRVRVGTRNESLAELIAKRARPDTGDVGRALASALSGAVTDGLLTDGEAAIGVDVLDNTGAPTGDVVNVGLSAFARGIVPALTKSLKRYR